ncbi:MAG: hypothetical protein IJ086_03840 [Clostridium sp.]|nr:hypothetical protein [Clostridium sp.]
MENKSILYICISIIIGFSILSISLLLNKGDRNRYHMISPNENNIIIFDSKTGDYWRKFIEHNEGPTDWTKESVNLKR